MLALSAFRSTDSKAYVTSSTFRRCVSGSDPRLWEKVVRGKATVLHLWRNGSTGAKIAAMKAVQKIIQAQTRGSADPRVRPEREALPS